MHGHHFAVMGDNDVAPGGGLYQRGHYDIVVLNPQFIAERSYEAIRAQNYQIYTDQVRNHLIAESPSLLYGLEFMYSRTRLTPGAAGHFAGSVLQDLDKLNHGLDLAGFMANRKILVFVKETPPEVQALVEDALIGQDGVVLQFAD
jgi:hypothetical protein